MAFYVTAHNMFLYADLWLGCNVNKVRNQMVHQTSIHGNVISKQWIPSTNEVIHQRGTDIGLRTIKNFTDILDSGGSDLYLGFVALVVLPNEFAAVHAALVRVAHVVVGSGMLRVQTLPEQVIFYFY